MSDKQFTFYWRDGKRNVLVGESVSDAFIHAGYDSRDLKSVDIYCDGDSYDYEWNKEKQKWVLKKQPHRDKKN